MCGIFGYIGDRDAISVCLTGLEHLEYRGYDSTGIAGISNGKIEMCKRAGKLLRLKQDLRLTVLDVAIAHTRWATHGAVNDQNAHPQIDSTLSCALVHNGIIENYAVLKDGLKAEGVSFFSDTDSEVVVQLVAKYYRGNLLHAFSQAISLLQGSFALLLIHKDHPDEMIAAAHDCPLSVAVDERKTETIVSSDPNAFFGTQFQILFLQDKEIAHIQKGRVEIFDGAALVKKEKQSKKIQGALSAPSKEGFEHFMLKEIYEQPSVIQQSLSDRWKDHRVFFDELHVSDPFFRDAQQAWILGCGTSSYAGEIGSLFWENVARFPSLCEIASEARYAHTLLPKSTLTIAISQSGETADTLAAIREAKKRGYRTLSICNVENSTLARETDGVLLLRAGPELSVCSTKAFTSQLVTLYLLGLLVGRLQKTVTEEQSALLYQEMQELPQKIQQILDSSATVRRIAQKYARYEDFFFMGRRYMYPTCLEAALKLKEISYVNANGYPAGELKHGPIALLDSQFPVVAFCANQQTEDKIVSNLMEVKARCAPVIAIAPLHLQQVKGIADDVIWVPSVRDELAPFLSAVVGQLFAYWIAKEKGCDIDQPRNLAKSVTVE